MLATVYRVGGDGWRGSAFLKALKGLFTINLNCFVPKGLDSFWHAPDREVQERTVV